MSGENTGKRHLVILDVNGILIERWHPAFSRSPMPAEKRHFELPGGHILFERPYMQPAVDLLCNSFSILVWSSMQMHNLRSIVDHVFRDNQHDLLGVWDQSYCTEVHDGMLPPGFRQQYDLRPGKPIFLKEVSKLQEFESLKHFYPDNVLLIDDSPYKAIRNPPCTAIHPLPWKLNTDKGGAAAGRDKELDLICKYLKRLLRADTVPEFVRDNPFTLWKGFLDRVMVEKQVDLAASWCVRRAGQAEALVCIWEKELLKAQPEVKERLLAVMTMAAKIVRSVADKEEGPAAMTLLRTLWPIFPRAVRHTLHNCKPDTDTAGIMRSVVDMFNVTFDPRRLLHTETGQSLGPLWREVEHAARNNLDLPGLVIVQEVWGEAGSDSKAFAKNIARLRETESQAGGLGSSHKRPRVSE